MYVMYCNIYGTVTNQVIDFSVIYKKIVAGNREEGQQDISDRSYFYVFHISNMYYLIGLHNSHETI